MSQDFSFIIPVYNRPEEVRELFQSLVDQTYTKSFEVVLAEDGSQQTAEEVVGEFRNKLSITYLQKQNSGPGDSRNYGMKRAKGNYFLILDSDCILPQDYLVNVENALLNEYVDCFGGPDNAHRSFTALQHAINYSMTSLWTTGGIRGHKSGNSNFQARSFNMGLSKKAFEHSGGFGSIHPGEDPDLSIRLMKAGFKIRLFSEVVVFHKRRATLSSFIKQVQKFGMVRPILNKWHPETASITYWFPLFFSLGFIISLLLFMISIPWLLMFYGLYYVLILIDAYYRSRRLKVALLSVITTFLQFIGYGYGFLISIILVNFSKKNPRQLFPELFCEPTLM